MLPCGEHLFRRGAAAPRRGRLRNAPGRPEVGRVAGFGILVDVQALAVCLEGFLLGDESGVGEAGRIVGDLHPAVCEAFEADAVVQVAVQLRVGDLQRRDGGVRFVCLGKEGVERAERPVFGGVEAPADAAARAEIVFHVRNRR